MLSVGHCDVVYVFFFNDTATTEIYTLSLHDALPISIVHEGTFTDWGHLVACGIGLAMGPLVRPERTDRRRGLLLVGGGLLAGAAACGVLLFTVPNREITLPSAGPTVEATVVGRPAD